MRKIWPIFFLAACGPLEVPVQDTKGRPVDVAYLFQNPLCLFLCNTSVTTSGSDVDTVGQGASGSNTQSQTVTTQQGVNQ